MASDARRAFDKNCEDVDRLLSVHTGLAGSRPGRKYDVEVLNKSAIVLITAFWEAYCEDLAAEGLEALVDHAPDAASLPKELRKSVAKELIDDADNLAVWRLAGDDWRNLLRSRLAAMQEERNRRLNTPKTAQINELFLKSLGIDRISSAWYWSGMSVSASTTKLDRYITLRGAIAHRGSAERTARKTQVKDYYNHVKRLVDKTGGRVNRDIRRITGQPLW